MTRILVMLAALAAVTGGRSTAESDVAGHGEPASDGLTRAQAKSTSTGVATIEALPGTVVRWSVPGTKRCTMGKRSWAALQESCYYPIDLLQKPGVLRVNRHGAGPVASARIKVLPTTYGSEQITLADIPQAKPSPADLKRNARDQALVAKLWVKRDGPAQFTLPLGPAARSLPEGKSFGATWVFNSPPGASELHSGVDYAVPTGTPIVAVADGTVAIAEDLFFAGNAVFIEHGDGLVSMYFHLAELKVRVGEDVKKGATIGLAGSTGRVTGSHLHLGIRWHGARIDPAQLLADPARIPAIRPLIA
jgi:murein DD-endopeptidase MepM/ murein hydrolase activator NlpD